MSLPIGVVLIGAVLGAATALTALGLILIWRSNRVINLAHGALGGVAGILAVNLFLSWEWPYWVALPASLALGAAVGVIVEMLVIRRFADSPRLVLMVATIGLTQALGALELVIPKFIFGQEGLVLSGFPTPLTERTWEVGPVLLNGDHLLITLVVPLVIAALAWFLLRSAPGRAIRAAADNAERARLLGIPVQRLNTMVWAIGGSLAALTFVLKAPFLGATPSVLAGPTLLLPALVAAVAARMESLPIAVGASVLLGIGDQALRWNTSVPSHVDVAMLVVLLVLLLARRNKLDRALDAGGTWQDTAAARPIPDHIRRLPEVRAAGWIMAAVLVGLAVWIPTQASPTTLVTLSTTVVWGIVAISLVVLTGWCGQISLGQFAFVGMGAVLAGNLMARWGVDLFASLFAATAMGALVALVLGVPALRIRGPFLAVVTLSFAVVLDSHVLNPNVYPALIPESLLRPVLWERFPLSDERNFLYLCLAALGLVILAARGIRRSRSGRVMIAGRDNRRAAEAMGVPVWWVSLMGFAAAGAIAGLAGGLHVLALNGVRGGSYQPIQSVEVFSMATIGGLGSIGGALTGALTLRGLQDVVGYELRLAVMGVGVLLVAWLLPGGLAQAARSVRDRLVRVVARRRNLTLDGLPPAKSAVVTTEPAVDDALVLTATRPMPDLADAAVRSTTGQPTGPRPLLSCEDIDVSYGKLQVLFGVDLQVAEGEVVALLGTNGAGKSTLLRALCGLSSTPGRVYLEGEDITGTKPENLVGLGIALMSGGKSIFPTLTVAEHLELACWTFRGDRQRIEADTAELLAMFPAVKERLGQMAGNLSGGEQQQLALAMTLLLRPRILLIDELSLGLSPIIVGMLLDVVREANRHGTTILVVEQSINVALELAERAVFMEKGEVRFEGPTRELLERPDLLRSVFLEGAGGVDDESTDADEEGDGSGDLSAGVGAIDLSALRTGNPAPLVDGPVLSVQSLEKRFGGVVAVSDVSFDVQPGEIVGLIGQNGAGKTTILDCISGFHAIDGGRVVFRNTDISEWRPDERARGRLGRSFQEARLFPSLTVSETLSVALERHVSSRSVLADATRQPASYESELWIAERTRELLALVGLTDRRDTPVSALSTGMRRILELACLLAEDPVLLILDEPSAGVAQRETEALGPLLRRVRDATGAGMVIIEHDMPLISGLCDRIIALEMGSVIAEGTPEEVMNNPLVIAGYLGTNEAAVNRSG